MRPRRAGRSNPKEHRWSAATRARRPRCWTGWPASFGDHDALVTEERTFTFAELRDEVRRTAAAMIGLGVRAGDRVAIWSPNTWHWVVACLATHYAGAVVVPLNTRYTAEEAADILARTQAPLLIAMGRFLGRRPGRRPRSRRTSRPAAHRPGADRGRPKDGRDVGRLRRRAAGADVGGRRARRGAVRPTTSPTSCSPPAPPAAAKACCARTGSRWRRPRRGRRAVSSPAPTATCASTRSSTTSATRPASWRACRPAPR